MEQRRTVNVVIIGWNESFRCVTTSIYYIFFALITKARRWVLDLENLVECGEWSNLTLVSVGLPSYVDKNVKMFISYESLTFYILIDIVAI